MPDQASAVPLKGPTSESGAADQSDFVAPEHSESTLSNSSPDPDLEWVTVREDGSLECKTILLSSLAHPSARGSTRAPTPERMRGLAPWVLVVPDEQAERLEQELLPLIQWRRLSRDTFVIRLEKNNFFATDPGALPDRIRRWRRSVRLLSEMECSILLAGPLAALPFELQLILGEVHAVGRLCFPALSDYGRYARKVVDRESSSQRAAAESGTMKRGLSFWVADDRTRATANARRWLIEPLLALAAPSSIEPRGPVLTCTELGAAPASPPPAAQQSSSAELPPPEGTQPPASPAESNAPSPLPVESNAPSPLPAESDAPSSLPDGLAATGALFVGIAHGTGPGARGTSEPSGAAPRGPGALSFGHGRWLASGPPAGPTGVGALCAPEEVVAALRSSRVALLVACFSAGAQHDVLKPVPGAALGEHVPEDELSPLPQDLLLQDPGPLGILAHLDRLTVPALSSGASRLTTETPWEVTRAARRLLEGAPLEDAIAPIQLALAAREDDYLALLETDRRRACVKAGAGGTVDRAEVERSSALLEAWLATWDARGWLIFGDPAVSLGSERVAWEENQATPGGPGIRRL